MWTISFRDIQALLSQITKKANVGPLIKHIKEKWEHFCRFSRVLRSPNIISSSWHYHVKPVSLFLSENKLVVGGGRWCPDWPLTICPEMTCTSTVGSGWIHVWGWGSRSGVRLHSSWPLGSSTDSTHFCGFCCHFLKSKTHYCSSSSN